MSTTTTTTYTYDAGVLVETVAVTEDTTPPPPPSPGGGLLAVKSYTPATDTTCTCNNYLEFDAILEADIWIEFAVPASKRVLVGLNAQTGQGVASKYEFWGLMIGAQVVAGGRVGYSTIFHSPTRRFVVDLPTHDEGDIVRLLWAHKTEQGGTANLYIGPTFGPAVMEVWAA